MIVKIIYFLIIIFLKKCVNKIFSITICLTFNENVIKIFYIINLYFCFYFIYLYYCKFSINTFLFKKKLMNKLIILLLYII